MWMGKNAARLMLGQLPPPEARLPGLPKSSTALPVQRGPGDGLRRGTRPALTCEGVRMTHRGESRLPTKLLLADLNCFRS